MVSAESHIDILINNAGIMFYPQFELTEDGHEMTWQSDHLGKVFLYFLSRQMVWFMIVMDKRCSLKDTERFFSSFVQEFIYESNAFHNTLINVWCKRKVLTALHHGKITIYTQVRFSSRNCCSLSWRMLRRAESSIYPAPCISRLVQRVQFMHRNIIFIGLDF